MKKTLLLCFLLSIAASSHAQVTWLNPFRNKTSDSKTEKEAVIQKVIITRLQQRDQEILKAGEMRAYNLDAKTIINVTIEPSSFFASNYDKRLERCHAILLDNQGTFILSETCREAMKFANKNISFVLDFSTLAPGHYVTVRNYPKNRLLCKKNYLLAEVDLPQTLQKLLPAIKAPVLVQKRDRLFNKNTTQEIIKQPLSVLFDNRLAATQKDRYFDALPAYFSADVVGFFR